MFIDQATIKVKSGRGGHGAATFRREKYVPEGGPSGGDGGDGGSVIVEATPDLQTLLDFRYRREFAAEDGEDGASKNRFGKRGADQIIKVPLGTVIYDADTDELLADLSHAGDRLVAARGGRGGRGNARFATPTHQAPTLSEAGTPGEQRTLKLELKLLADAGLIGLPNAGKSTLISVISAARPKIADYPFTTLVPQLGVVRFPGGDQLVVADIPGLIEGAHAGAGLGHEFLRHVERTRLLLHVLDLAGGPEERDPMQDWETVNTELARHSPELGARPQVAVLNKMDLPGARANLERVKDALEGRGIPTFPISAATREGLEPLLRYLHHRMPELPLPLAFVRGEPAPPPPVQAFTITRQQGIYNVKGDPVERLVAMTDLDNPEALHRLQRSFSRIGLNDALKAHGVQDGDVVRIGEMEFNYVE